MTKITILYEYFAQFFRQQVTFFVLFFGHLLLGFLFHRGQLREGIFGLFLLLEWHRKGRYLKGLALNQLKTKAP